MMTKEQIIQHIGEFSVAGSIEIDDKDKSFTFILNDVLQTKNATYNRPKLKLAISKLASLIKLNHSEELHLDLFHEVKIVG